MSASVALAVLLATGTVRAAGPHGADASTQIVSDAIEAAVRARVAPNATVLVDRVIGLRLPDEVDRLVAVPAPSARIGEPIRFVLQQVGRRGPIGEVTATVQVRVQAVRTTAAIERGRTLGAGDVTAQAIDLTGRPLRPLPSLDEALGSRVTRGMPAGAVVTRSDIASEPLVRSGQPVRTLVRIGGVEIEGRMIAAESGAKGDVIRVLQEESRHAVQARVTGRGEVEVVDAP